MPKGVHKAVGLRLLTDYLALDKGQVMAMGDEENDLTMLEWASHIINIPVLITPLFAAVVVAKNIFFPPVIREYIPFFRHTYHNTQSGTDGQVFFGYFPKISYFPDYFLSYSSNPASFARL